VVSDRWVCKVGWLCLGGSSGVVGGWCGGFCALSGAIESESRLILLALRQALIRVIPYTR
jgi:hypothetical protein